MYLFLIVFYCNVLVVSSLCVLFEIYLSEFINADVRFYESELYIRKVALHLCRT